VLFLLFIIDSIRGFTQSNCPLLRTYRDNSGLLAVNKTVIVNNELPVHCQWLIASSFQQVIKSNLWIDNEIILLFNLIQKILVEFEYVLIPISIKEYLHTGCRRASISLWTAGLKHEKLELCGDRRHVRIEGIGRILIIELKISDPKLNVNFLMKYQLIENHHCMTDLYLLENRFLY